MLDSAAQPKVLQLCRKMCDRLPEWDPLVKMVFARVGFLQTLLWSRAHEETSEFLVSNPDVAAIILREMSARRQDEFNGRTLPSLERPTPPLAPPPPGRYDNAYMPMLPGGMPAHHRRHPGNW